MIDLNILTIFINDPYNDMNNFNLGYEYELIGQTAIALSYYLRCAEYTNNDNLSYECLLRMSKCISKQGNRDVNELTCLEHAISIKPGRSEAYYIMSLYHSYRGNWLKSYMYACIGLVNTDLQSIDMQDMPDSNKLIKDIGYYSYNQLLFQKAYSGYNKGKLKESKMIYNDLLNKNITNEYRIIIKNNLYNYPDTDKLFDLSETIKVDSNITIINNYNDNKPASFYLYENCSISKKIKEGNIWEKYIHNIIDEYVNNKFVSVEVGSHVGTCSVKLAQKSKYLYCFEPLIHSYNLLCKNLTMNKCNNVKTFLVGLSNSNEKSKLKFIALNNPGGCGLISKYNYGYENCLHYKKNVHILDDDYEVNLKKLDSYNLKIDFLKIDVEGYEDNVLRGSINTIKESLPIIIFEAFEDMINFNMLSNKEFEKRFNYILELGYVYKKISEYDWFLIHPKRFKIGIDIGACIGETIHYFGNCDKVYAIEPGKEEFIQLKEKYKNDKRIIPLNYAIAEENGSKSLNCYHNGRFSSFLEFQKEGEFYNFCQGNVEGFDNLKEKINVETKRLDTFIDENNIDEIEFIKIDTQGYDLNVVKSLGKYIDKVKKIQLESQIQTLYKNSPLKDEIISYMTNNNFKLIGNEYGEISKDFEEDLIFLNNKFITNHDYNKLDIVLQGKFNENVLHIAEYYLELEFVNNIIISCWQDDIIPQINNDRIKIIRSEIPKNPGTGQRNLQIVSSLSGIKESNTEFIIKIRNDQRYTHESMINMYKFYEGYKERKLTFYYDEERPRNRICVSGNFSEFSFHPRDHLFWGNREDLIDLFSSPLEIGKVTDTIRFIVPEDYSLYYEYFIRTETYIGAHYLSNFDQKINYYLLDPKKYLYDNSEKYSETLGLSDKLTPQVFKSFPKEGIDLEWYKYKWKTYPYEGQRDQFGERWHEDGL